MKHLLRGALGLGALSAVTLGLFVISGDLHAPHAATGKKAGSEVVAEVAGQKITRAALDEKAQGQTLKLRMDIYNAERNILAGMVEQEILEKEAKKKGMSVEDLVQKEINAKVTPVTDDDIQAWYDANKSRVRGRALDQQLKGQVQQFLTAQRQAEAKDSYMDPLKEKYDVSISLDPPRVPVQAADNPVKGPKDAPITIVEFTDFQCPYCSRVGPTLERIEEVYKDKVRIVFRDFPLDFHREAPKAHEAAACAEEQGKFWAYHDKLFSNQRALKMENLKQYAQELGLDTAKFNACLESGKMETRVTSNLEAGKGYGVSGTPAFFINGRFLNGAQPFESFAEVINDELERKGIELPSGG